ncbi:hypothetical protein P1X14_16745 [Sphingomonas sp. AOB5]|uniref:hypothetical protein n=1 Tax=Sphingomonas sp. AOB5 TaxID=3034017 RepID=UPI0023F9F6DE|nr:hypothetical protein [Sphingomonas sp. AOB5]MDF7776908.1 hypothetical protein [Sphingomonas sp. AOB5]
MKSSYYALSCAVMLCALNVTPACAQTAGASAAEAAPSLAAQVAAAPVAIRLPMNTSVRFEFVTELNSKTSKIDEMFPIRLITPIVIDGRIVVPAGAMGEGQVVHAAKAGWGGKAGELTVTVRYVEHQGVRIPLRRLRMGEPAIGDDRTQEAFAVTSVIPLAGFVMNGGEKTIVPGTRAHAIISADTDLPAPVPEPIAAVPAVTATTTSN